MSRRRPSFQSRIPRISRRFHWFPPSHRIGRAHDPLAKKRNPVVPAVRTSGFRFRPSGFGHQIQWIWFFYQWLRPSKPLGSEFLPVASAPGTSGFRFFASGFSHRNQWIRRPPRIRRRLKERIRRLPGNPAALRIAGAILPRAPDPTVPSSGGKPALDFAAEARMRRPKGPSSLSLGQRPGNRDRTRDEMRPEGPRSVGVVAEPAKRIARPVGALGAVGWPSRTQPDGLG